MKRAVFLAHGPYRRRRLRDAARLLPFAGGVLFLLPLFWGWGTGPAGLYLLGIWLGLVVVAAIFERGLRGGD